MPDGLIDWLIEFAFGFVGKAMIVMLIVAITGILIYYITTKFRK